MELQLKLMLFATILKVNALKEIMNEDEKARYLTALEKQREKFLPEFKEYLPEEDYEALLKMIN